VVGSGIESATAQQAADLVHIVSHGPHCLDGVTAAVVVARYHAGRDVRPQFANNPEINEVLLAIEPPPTGRKQDLWITDISWNRSETDRHLRELANNGTRIFWVDHHRTAIERLRRGVIGVPFATMVVEDTYAASRLVYEHLLARLADERRDPGNLLELERLVLLADDNDRWIHALAGSRELALTVAAMQGTDAFRDLLTIDGQVTYTPSMREAEERVKTELAASHALAERTRSERRVGPVTVVAAWCAGYPSEIGDAWGRRTANAVLAFYDTKSRGVSFRRSPDCAVDLSRLAERFGGGGHEAAAGCEIAGIDERDAAALAAEVARALAEID